MLYILSASEFTLEIETPVVTKEEGRRKKEEGRRKREEGRGNRE
ncbi:hypothetical protein [Okeania sp. SIO1I7]|nr:hypothetical protein [Okeania sp. SIO1I7]